MRAFLSFSYTTPVRLGPVIPAKAGIQWMVNHRGAEDTEALASNP